jgi:hypothetical protein
MTQPANPNYDKTPHLDELAAAVKDIAEVQIIEPSEWEMASGEHDGMSLVEYVRRFNTAQDEAGRE